MSIYTNAQKILEASAKIAGLNPAILEILKKPKRIIQVSFPVKMDDGSARVFKGYRVQHNNTLGPHKGGLRYHEATDLDEVKSLALWMTIKCAAVGIPLGGGKGGITVNPKELSESEKEKLTRAFVRAIADCIGPDKDIPAPDMGTNAQMMGWFADEYSKIVGKPSPAVITGKPVEVGGSLGRDTATAQGGFYILKEMVTWQRGCQVETLPKIVVQGFGNAGWHIARLCHEAGYKIIAVSDSRGGILNENGLNPNEVLEHKKITGSVVGFAGAGNMSNEDLLELECDVLIPSALENVITDLNAQNIKAKIILELANGPTRPEADKILFEKGIKIVPDVLANAGGVVVSYFEWLQNKADKKWSAEQVQEKLKPIMLNSFRAILEIQNTKQTDMRTAAYVVALKRLEETMSFPHPKEQ
ncbi:MAG: Glu/Leu/Phe/Val dehydrogenase [Patescibacteria group bacterium]|nr:Glu/Leu/Phe/Val dehydrogenase [Patescibacteria group bacterium]